MDLLFDLLLFINVFIFVYFVVIKVGGYLDDTVGEDMELVVRLHRYYRERNEKYRVRSTAKS